MLPEHLRASNFSINIISLQMFYRRKLILATLEIFGGALSKINLQKILFLISTRQSKPTYDFIPYKFGSYSFSLNSDLDVMTKQGFLKEDEQRFTKNNKYIYLNELNAIDRTLANQIYILFKNYDSDALMKYTYMHYPYYAINSIAATRLLDEQQMEKVLKAKPESSSIVLFTIGYESVSLEKYLNKLITNDIKVLVDVRNNPLSQKYGFSKSQLLSYCHSIGIEYVHIPQLGIQSEARQELKTQNDYDALFRIYTANTLFTTTSFQQQLLDLLIKKQRIALTCFEANIDQCHRKHLAYAIAQLPGWNFELKHI